MSAILDSLIGQTQLDALVALAERAPAGGHFAELGVYRGGSASHLYRITEERGVCLYLFDTFTGIPEATAVDEHKVGDFSDVNLALLRKLLPHAQFRVGIFPDTLSDEVTDLSFVHVDCDQYESCKAAVTLLWPRLLPGGIMAFDDYNFRGIKQATEALTVLTGAGNLAYAVKAEGHQP